MTNEAAFDLSTNELQKGEDNEIITRQKDAYSMKLAFAAEVKAMVEPILSNLAN